MDIFQDELDDKRKMWNTHLIRKSRYSGGVTGIPNELFYLPGIQGYLSWSSLHFNYNSIIVILLYNSPLYYSYQHAGYDSCSCEVDADDVGFCFQYATRKKNTASSL